MKATGGRWQATGRSRYFLAGAPSAMDEAVALGGEWDLLVAVNPGQGADSPYGPSWVKKQAEAGHNILIDSGVYTLAMNEVRRTGLHMDQVRSMPVEGIKGYDKLLGSYLSLVGPLKDLAWGYIELDWGNPESKTRIRDGLEARGLRPIPVYHPLNDGWDYFDFLASRYDRLCVANLVHADKETRDHLLYTISERTRAYPGLWVHALGVTVNQASYSYGIKSYDSSTWLEPARWGGLTVRVLGRSAGDVVLRYDYSDPDGNEGYKATWALSGYASRTDGAMWGQHVQRLEQLEEEALDDRAD